MMSQTQLAKELGVSQQAVSFALNGTGTLAEATRQRILEGAERLGYRKNPVPQMMTSGKTKSVGILMEESGSLIPHTLIRGALSWLEKHHHTLTFLSISTAQLQSRDTPPLHFRERRIDGCLIFSRRDVAENLLPLLKENQIPSVWVNEDFPLNAVYPDDVFLGQRSTELLVEHGCKRIAYFGPDREGGHYSERDRRLGYERVMKRDGLPLRFVDVSSLPMDQKLPATIDVLQAEDRPDGIVCYGKGEADNLMLAASRLHVSVPDDLKLLVIGYAGAAVGSIFYSTLRIPLFHIGVQAIELLAERMSDPDGDLASIAVRHEQLDLGMTLETAR